MPTETLGQRTGATYAGNSYAMLADFATTTNFSNGNNPQSDLDHPSLERMNGLLSIAGPVTVTDAFFTISITSGQVGAVSVPVQRVLRVWVEAQATWIVYTTGNSWTTAGCLGDGTDRVATESCSFAYPGGFATGDIASTNNSGLIAELQTAINTATMVDWLFTPTGSLSFASATNATAASRPMLTIVYTSGGGGQATRSMQQHRLRRV